MMFFQSNGIKNKLLAVPIAFVLLFSVFAFAQSDTIETNVPALKDVFANDFYIGCLLSYPHIGFASDPYVSGQGTIIAPNGGYLIKYHMNSMSPGNNMKPSFTVDTYNSGLAYNAASPSDKDSVNTHPIVRFNGNLIAQLNWVQRQGFTFRGHTLVWHNQTPHELFYSGYTDAGGFLTKTKMIERMDNYIGEIIRVLHEGWPGMMTAIDVVNEAVIDDGSDIISSDWYTVFGDSSYIMKAFELTRKWTVYYGETQIKLYYNDYNAHIAEKADGIVRICKPIFEAGYLDGIGMQDHDGYNYPTVEQWIAAYDKFVPICNEISVTELDVTQSDDTPTKLTTQANQYAALFKCFVERSYFSGRGKLISVSKDGLNDQYAFKPNASLWNSNNKCKPAFYAVVAVGNYYNALDSLIAATDTLQQSDYSAESWLAFTTALSSARDAMSQNYSYTISAADSLANACTNLETALHGLTQSVIFENTNGNEPENFALIQNYPNPFNPTTTIGYQLSVTSHLTIKVYNLLGKEVATLVEGVQQAGHYSVNFDASGLVGGIYLYQLKAGKQVETKKFILLK